MKTLVIGFAAYCAVLSFAPLPLLCAPRSAAFRPATSVHSQFAIADFDGDQVPDFATVQMGRTTGSAAHYSIQIELSRGAMQTVSFIAPLGGLEIIPRDVNGDQALDLVVSAQWLKGPVAVLLNDGHGNFTVTDPGNYPSAVLGQTLHWKVALEEVRDWAALPLVRGGNGQLRGNGNLYSACESSERIISEEFCLSAASFTSFRFGRSPPSRFCLT